MRIGELAQIAGVTTRTIRHYHRVGVLREPTRTENGYRTYAFGDVVRLLRVRRLTELGLSLEEVADVLADASGADLREVLAAVDDDLTARERQLHARRRSIAALLAREDDLYLPEHVAEATARLREVFGDDQRAVEREQMVLEATNGLASEHAAAVDTTYRRMLDDPDTVTLARAANARFEALAGLDPHDPTVDAVAAEAARLGAAAMSLAPGVAGEAGDPVAADELLATVTAGMDPAQQRCMRLMFAHWREAAP